MSRLQIGLGLGVAAVLAFLVPALLLKPAPRPRVTATPVVNAEATSPAAPDAALPTTDAVSGVQAEADVRTAGSVTVQAQAHDQPKPPVVLPGFTGAAKVAGQALLDKMMGKQNEMTRWANVERERIKDMEPKLQQMEQHIKDLDARGDEMQKQLERMRAEHSNTADYDALQKSYNDLVVERNQSVKQYEQQFADYNQAVKDFDGRIAAYDSSVHKLKMPTIH